MSSSELESESVILPKRSSIPENQKLLRSLIISGRMSFEPSSNDSSLSRFPSLRALLLVDHAESDRFLESLGKLKHMRFLFFLVAPTIHFNVGSGLQNQKMIGVAKNQQ